MERSTGPNRSKQQPVQPASGSKGLDESLECGQVARREPSIVLPPPAPSAWTIEMLAKEQGFDLFDMAGYVLFRRDAVGFGNTPDKDDRREWLRFEDGKWMGYAIHTDIAGEDWHESATFEGTPAEISAALISDRATTPTNNENAE